MKKVTIILILILITIIFMGVRSVIHVEEPIYFPSLENRGRYQTITIGGKGDKIKAVYKVKSDDIREWPVILTIRANGKYGIRRNHNHYEVWTENSEDIVFKTDWELTKID